MIDRRTFLQIPLVFGLHELFVPAQDPPAWWKSARDRMKETGRPGLVFVAPEGEKARESLAKAILDLLEGDASSAREIFCGAVVVCLLRLADAEPGSVVILDPAGAVVGKSAIDVEDLRDAARFEESYSKRLYGEGDARLSVAAEG